MKESMAGGTGNLTAAARSSADEVELWKYRTNLLWQVMSALILIVGIPNNIIILKVVKRIKRKSTSYSFFYAIAIWDLVQLMDGVFPKCINAFFGVNAKNLSIVLCVGTKYIGYVTGLITAHLLVAVTVYRAMAVIWPFRLKTMCTHKQVRLVIALIIIGPFTYKAYMPFVLHMESGKCKWSKFYIERVYPTMTMVNGVLYTYLPTFLIVSGNVCLIYSLSTSRNKARSNSSYSGTIATVVAISLIFLVLGIPIATERIISYNYPSLASYPYSKFLHELFETVYYMNNSVNFFVYYPTGKQFRRETNRLFARCFGITETRRPVEKLLVRTLSRRQLETTDVNTDGSLDRNRILPLPSPHVLSLTTDAPSGATASKNSPSSDDTLTEECTRMMLMAEIESCVDQNDTARGIAQD